MASPSDPPTGRAGDTEQFPVARTGAHAAQPSDAAPTDGPAHAVGSDSGSGITRGGWWAITIAAAVLLILGFLLTFGPARYWTPVPVVFLGYFLISGLIGLVFWKGVRELRDSNPNLHSGDGPASPGARVAAAIGAVGIASALILLPAGLSDAPANAAPCPDGSSTCGPTAPTQDQPTQGNGGNTTAPQAPNTTVPGYTPPDAPPQQGNGSTPTVQGQVPTMPTGDTPSNGCIFNCGPTQAQAPQTGQATPPQTGQNPVTTAPNTPATTPQAPTTTPQLRTPTPETTTSASRRARDINEQRSSNEDRDKNSGIPYQAAELAAVAGTYRRRTAWANRALQDGRTVASDTTQMVFKSMPDRGSGDMTPGSSTSEMTEGNSAYNRAIQYIYDEMMRNSSGKVAESIRAAWNMEGDENTGDVSKGGKAAALAIWTAQVHSGGSWDHKPKLAAMFNMEKMGYYFRMPGSVRPDGAADLLFYDIFSNIHYGYVGRASGIPSTVLMGGQMIPLPGVGLVDRGDLESIRLGMQLYDKFGADMTSSQLNLAVTEMVKEWVAAGGRGKVIVGGTGGLA